MTDTLKLLWDRKSVRSYSDREIDPREKRLILESAIQAPTAGNMTLYTILDITDQSIKDRLAETCDNQPFIAKAKMVLIFCADYRRWLTLFRKYVPSARTPSYGDLFLAQADALIAAQNTVVAAESLGIGSCYVGDITERFEIHRELLKLPQYVVPVGMLCFGYPTPQQEARPKPERFRVEDIVYENGYDTQRAAQMEEMISQRAGGMDAQQLEDWVKRFCARKWDSAFSVEMSRSCQAMVEDWCKEDALLAKKETEEGNQNVSGELQP